MVPNAKDILIRVERDRRKFLSKIHIHVPGKVLHAEKKAETVWEAIDQSYKAVLKQIDRVKKRNHFKRRRTKEVVRRLVDTEL